MLATPLSHFTLDRLTMHTPQSMDGRLGRFRTADLYRVKVALSH
jgi:hypothetical protein